MMLVSDRLEWMERAACSGSNTKLFFPEHGESTGEAKMICRGCPVRMECARHGAGEEFGVWGGLSHRQRKRVRREALSA